MRCMDRNGDRPAAIIAIIGKDRSLMPFTRINRSGFAKESFVFSEITATCRMDQAAIETPSQASDAPIKAAGMVR